MDILNTVIMNIDLMYIVSCNAATFFITKTIDGASKKKLKKWWKRLIAAVVAVVIALIMHHSFGHETEPLFYGAFIQFVTWDYLFKPIVKSLPDWFTPSKGVEIVEPDIYDDSVTD